MSILVVGISHRSAPLPVLERLGLDAESADKLALSVQSGPHVRECAVLATCNRVEVYADVDRFHAGVDDVSVLLAEVFGGSLAELTPYLYVHFDEGAVAHLFSVASGLDSMVVGESQVLGQVREMLRSGQDNETVGAVLNLLLQHALRVAKRAHAETGLDRAGQSMVTVALDQALGESGDGVDVQAGKVLIIGAGSMASLAAATVRRRGADEIVIASRSLLSARTVADHVSGRPVVLSELEAEIARVDLVISCTGAMGVVLDAEGVRSAVSHGATGRRPDRPLVIVDLALPHDVELSVAEIDGVSLIGLDDLGSGAGASGPDDADVLAAKAIVASEVGDYGALLRAAGVTPTVVALRAMASQVVDTEMTRLDSRLKEHVVDAEVIAEIEHTVRRVVDKLLHGPTVRVKELAGERPATSYAEALRDLFALDQSTVESVSDVPSALAPRPVDEPRANRSPVDQSGGAA